MARPKSEEKRSAILLAATEVVARHGTEASTSSITKDAGVAEGSLFTYFPSKDALLNELYLDLKTSLRDSMMPGYPLNESARNRALYAWNCLVAWGLAHPSKRKAMNVLGLSERVTPESKAAGMRAFASVGEVLVEISHTGKDRELPAAFLAVLMGSMAETTTEWVSSHLSSSDEVIEAGFNAFWRAAGCA